MGSQPAAFFSYSRFDDQHEGGKLTQLRERLSAEVQFQTSEEFLIFQDRKDIAWGQNWKARIDEALDAVTLLIPIVTPNFFRSPACREELERFLKRERQLGRGDLILPVYYLSTPELDDPNRREGDELARVLATRQYADWRDLRFEPLTSEVVRKAIAQLASRMRDSFWHTAQDKMRLRQRLRSAVHRAQDKLAYCWPVKECPDIIDDTKTLLDYLRSLPNKMSESVSSLPGNGQQLVGRVVPCLPEVGPEISVSPVHEFLAYLQTADRNIDDDIADAIDDTRAAARAYLRSLERTGEDDGKTYEFTEGVKYMAGSWKWYTGYGGAFEIKRPTDTIYYYPRTMYREGLVFLNRLELAQRLISECERLLRLSS